MLTYRRRGGRRGVIAALSALALAATALAAPTALASQGSNNPANATGTPAKAPAAATQKSGSGALQNGYGPTAAQQSAMSAASAQARKTGKPVLVNALTTPTWIVTAKPGGGFALSGSPLPVRAKHNGVWVPVSTTLHRTANGTISPAATAYGTVAFSGGGIGPMVTTTSTSGASYQLTWPGALPVPSVSGDTATYTGILPGVDLKLTANAGGGFSDVLVVHSAAAAANPKLQAVTLAAHTSGGLDAKHGILATSRDGLSLQISGGLEWDSNTTPTQAMSKAAAASAAQTAKIAASDPSTASQPGIAAHTGAIGIGISAAQLSLRPDTALLKAKNAAWPAYIDPTFQWHPAAGATPAFDEIKQGAPCNGVSDYDNSSSSADSGQLGVGYVTSNYSCDGIQRAYYQWQLPGIIDGGQIGSATVEVAEVWQASFNCSFSHNVNLHWSTSINSGTSWNTRPSNLTGTDSYSNQQSITAAWNGTGCPSNGKSYAGFPVGGANSPLQISANNHFSQITFGLTDDAEESAQTITDFARFSDNPTLNIAYGHAPPAPSAHQLSAYVNSNTAGCATSSPYPLIGKSIVGSPVNLRASNIASRDGDLLQATFKYWLTATPGTTYTGTSADGLANNSTAQYSIPLSFTSALTDGQNVSWQVETYNGLWYSGWSPVCTFTADPTAPDPPTIAANTTYPNTDTGGAVGAPPGTTPTFQIATPGTDIAAKYYYTLDQAIPGSNVPVSETQYPIGTSASSPTDTWPLYASTGTTAADTAGTSPATLQSGASWVTDPVRGYAMATNGTSTGYAQTTGTVVPTTGDFSVSAWVKLNNTSGWETVLSENDTVNSAFYLQYDAGDKAWAFAMENTNTNNPTTAYRAHGSTTPSTGTWYQLTGVYTHSSGLMQLYVNGALAGTNTDKTPLTATGPLAIGRSLYNGANADFVNGDIGGAQVYSRALTSTEAASMYNATAFNITPLSPGPHTLSVQAADTLGQVSATSDYHFMVASHQNSSCGTLTQCYNNTAISSDTNQSAGNADGTGESYSATDLTNAGWKSGGSVSIDGANLPLPAFGAGQKDNVVAQNQSVTYSYTAPSTGSSSLVMLVSATNGVFPAPSGIQGDMTTPYVPANDDVAGVYCFTSTDPDSHCASQGSITYASGCSSATNNAQPYTLTVPDWTSGPSELAAVTLPHENTASGTQSSTTHPMIYAFSIPLYPGCTVQSVTLPDNAILGSDYGSREGDVNEIHLFSLGTRDTTTGTVEANGTTAALTSPNTWTGAWASDTEGNYNFESGNFNNQSFRILLQPSVTGGVVRIKLDNALGTSPMDIGHVTIAPTSGNDVSPNAGTTATPTTLTFSGSDSTAIPEGGMVYSDPINYSVAASSWYAVSFNLTNSVPDMVQHSWATDAYEYVAPIGSGDHTADQAATEYTASGAQNGTFTDLVTGLDVETQGTPTEVVLGDNLIDAWQPNTAPASPNRGAAQRLSDDLATASATAPNAAGTATGLYGTINAGIESNQIAVDNPETASGGNVGGPSVLSRIDRDVMDEPGINTLVIDEGLEDALTKATEPNLYQYYQDLWSTAINTQTSQAGGSFINVINVGMTPCAGYNGDGAAGSGTAGNDPCTTTTGGVDSVRTSVNSDLATNPPVNNQGAVTYFFINPDPVVGVPDGSSTALATQAMVGTSFGNTPSDPVNLTNAGIGALASAIMAPQDDWDLDDGTGTNIADSALVQGTNPYITADLGAYTQANDLTVNGTGTWTTGSVGAQTNQNLLKFDGTSTYASSSNTGFLNTASSFTISAWANLSAIPTGYGTIAAEAGAQASGFYLQYNPNAKSWCLNFMTSDVASAAGASSIPCSTTTPTANTWYHLVGTYNAATKTARLYVNGTLASTATGITTWAATGSMLIGADQYNAAVGDYFPGEISNVQAYNYTFTQPQITALYDQIS